MKFLISTLTLFALSTTSLASDSYISQGQFQQALESYYSDTTVGTGAKSNSCLLCHSSSLGGPGNINGSFGADFLDAAMDVVGFGGGLPTFGPNSLESVIADATFRAADSDGDGFSNDVEFQDNTDPADNVNSNTTGGGSDSGGCGMITPTKKPNGRTPPGALLLLLPLGLAFHLRQKKA